MGRKGQLSTAKKLLIAVVVLLVGSGIGLFTLMPKYTGGATILWSHTFPKGTFSPILLLRHGGGVIYLNRRSVSFFDSTGNQISEYDVSPEILFRSGALTDSVGNMYVSGTGIYLYSFDPAGNLRWKKQIPTPTPESGIATPSKTYLGIYNDENLVVQLDNGELLKVALNGDLISHSVTDYVVDKLCDPIQFDENKVIVSYCHNPTYGVDDTEHVVSCIDFSGDVIWSVSLPGLCVHSTDIWGNRILVSMEQEKVYAVDFDGNRLWEFIDPERPPGYYGHHEVVGSTDGSLFLLQINRGILFKLDTAGQLFESGGLQIDEDQLCISDDNEVITVINTDKPQSAIAKLLLSVFPATKPNPLNQKPETTLLTYQDFNVLRSQRLPDGFRLEAGLGPAGEIYGYTTGKKDKGSVSRSVTIYCIQP